MLKPLLSWIFGPHIFEVVAFFLAATGLAMALSPSKANIQAAHWFFGTAFLMVLGRVIHWLVTNGLPYPKPLIGAILFALIGGGWMIVYQWVEKQIQELFPPSSAVAVGIQPASGKLISQVMTVQFEPVFRFYQSPPVYFQRLDTMLRISLTNQTGKPLYIKNHAVAALKGVEWVQFKNADSAGHEPYAFGVMETSEKSFIRRFDLSANGFDYVTQQRPLNPNESIELWMFFISGLTRKNLQEISQFKFAFYDAAKEEFSCTSAYSVQSDKGTVVGTSTGDLKALNMEPIPSNLREEPPH